MYPRIENSVRWSAHPESRTDPHGQRRVGAVERAPAAGLGAPTPRMGDGGARSRSRIPRGAACRVGGRWCVLLNGDPTRPLFSRTPSPARKFAQRHRRRADRRRRLWQPVHHAAPAVGDGHGDGRVCLPPGAHGAGSYSSHPNDSTGTWAGDAAVISQIDAFRAFRSQ